MISAAIYLGDMCNANCKYCHRETSSIKLNTKRIISQLRKLKVTHGLRFLGGEPLLYMDVIREIVTELRSDIRFFNIGTNGILLRQYVDELNELNISVTISYDGEQGQVLRGTSLDYAVLSKVKNLLVSNVLTIENCDLNNMIRSFNKFNTATGKNLTFIPYLIHPTNDKNRKYIPTDQQLLEFSNSAKMVISNFIRYRDSGMDCYPLWGVYNWIANKYYFNNYSWGETTCVSQNRFKLNPNGDLVTCLYIRDQILEIEDWQSQQAQLMDQYLPQCKICKWFKHCGSGCLKASPKIECWMNKELLSWFKEHYGNRTFIPF